MNGPFESVTKCAIEEILRAHAKDSKFGLVLAPESIRDVVADLYNLVQTSRSLKAAGDRLMSGAPPPAPRKPETARPSRASNSRGTLW
jgi:hypothetical protein